MLADGSVNEYPNAAQPGAAGAFGVMSRAPVLYRVELSSDGGPDQADGALAFRKTDVVLQYIRFLERVTYEVNAFLRVGTLE